MIVLWIILWLILGVLALFVSVLLLVLVLLAIPIRYTVNIENGEAREDGTNASVRVSYLFKLIRAYYDYKNGDGQLKIRVLWFAVGEKKKKIKAHVETDMPAENESTESGPIEDKPDETARPSKFQRFFKSAKDKIERINHNANTVLTYPNLKTIISLSVNALRKIFKILKPKYFDISGTVGFADPSRTGLFIGFYEAITQTLKIRKNVRLAGNFDTPHTTAELRVVVRGSINIARLLLPVIGLLLKKPIHILISDMLK